MSGLLTWQFLKASETVGTPQEFSENFDGLDTVLQDNGNFEFNNDIVNNMSTTASVAFPQLIELFTSATINGNVKIHFGKQWNKFVTGWNYFHIADCLKNK